MTAEHEIAARERRVHLIAEAEELLRKSLSTLHMAQLGTIEWNRMVEQLQDCLQGMRTIAR